MLEQNEKHWKALIGSNCSSEFTLLSVFFSITLGMQGVIYDGVTQLALFLKVCQILWQCLSSDVGRLCRMNIVHFRIHNLSYKHPSGWYNIQFSNFHFFYKPFCNMFKLKIPFLLWLFWNFKIFSLFFPISFRIFIFFLHIRFGRRLFCFSYFG